MARFGERLRSAASLKVTGNPRITLAKIGILLMACCVAGYADTSDDCSNQRVSARAVNTPEEVRHFAECAAEYVEANGPAEARRAFKEDERWSHGSVYVVVQQLARNADRPLIHVFPPDPTREGGPGIWDNTSFGTDLDDELYRMLGLVDSGWTYYAVPHPETGRERYKRSFAVKVDWGGAPAVLLAGIFERDIPGACYEDEVNAAVLAANPSEQRLREFVRCAANMVVSMGYSAKNRFEMGSRWAHGSVYAFVLDMMGNQVLSSSKVRVNGSALHEFGGMAGLMRQFHGRDIIRIADAFGEMHIYYHANNPQTGLRERKVGLLKRVVAQGVPLLVGAGYYAAGTGMEEQLTCSDHYVTASSVRSPETVRAFVQCAAEYVAEHGTEEARRAFKEDERWKSGPNYVFVKGLNEMGVGPTLHAYPQNPEFEGMQRRSLLVDGFGTNLDLEQYRMLSIVDSGWSYYASRNPVSNRVEPKMSYAKAIDWNGERAVIVSGTHLPDLPGTCYEDTVNAANVEAGPTEQNVTDYVRCASYVMEPIGYFASRILTESPRWIDGSTYLYGWDARAGTTQFSGNPSSFTVTGRLAEALFDGRDALGIVDVFGDAVWYYRFINRATGETGRKVGIVTRVWANGTAVALGSGYH